MRDKEFFNTGLFVFINPKMKEFIEDLSSNKNNSAKELGNHHVIHDALKLLYEQKKGKKFTDTPSKQ